MTPREPNVVYSKDSKLNCIFCGVAWNSFFVEGVQKSDVRLNTLVPDDYRWSFKEKVRWAWWNKRFFHPTTHHHDAFKESEYIRQRNSPVTYSIRKPGAPVPWTSKKHRKENIKKVQELAVLSGKILDFTELEFNEKNESSRVLFITSRGIAVVGGRMATDSDLRSPLAFSLVRTLGPLGAFGAAIGAGIGHAVGGSIDNKVHESFKVDPEKLVQLAHLGSVAGLVCLTSGSVFIPYEAINWFRFDGENVAKFVYADYNTAEIRFIRSSSVDALRAFFKSANAPTGSANIKCMYCVKPLELSSQHACGT